MNEVHFQPPTVIDNSNPELRVCQRVFEGPCYVHTMLGTCQDLFSVPNPVLACMWCPFGVKSPQTICTVIVIGCPLPVFILMCEHMEMRASSDLPLWIFLRL